MVAALFVSAWALRADSLEAILTRMDQAAPGFTGLTANVIMDEYQAIIDSHTVQHGTFQMQRAKKGEVTAVVAFTGTDDARTLSFKGKTVLIYFPHLNTYQQVDLGKNSQALNQFLLLGFGSSGTQLKEGYTITVASQETAAGRPTTKLLLVPKDANVLKTLAKVEIWIPADAAYPVQQQFYDPAGNYRKVSYDDIHLNPSIKVEFRLPPGAKKS